MSYFVLKILLKTMIFLFLSGGARRLLYISPRRVRSDPTYIAGLGAGGLRVSAEITSVLTFHFTRNPTKRCELGGERGGLRADEWFVVAYACSFKNFPCQRPTFGRREQ